MLHHRSASKSLASSIKQLASSAAGKLWRPARPQRVRSQWLRQGATESLEVRCLLSADVEMLADLNSLSRGVATSGEETVEAGGLVYFIHTPADFSRQLWRTDGTEAGTILLVSTNSQQGVYLGELEAFQDQLFFRKFDSQHGVTLWTTDGSVAGTRLALDVLPGISGASLIGSLKASSQGLAFVASETDSSNNTVSHLIMTQGTLATTVTVPTTPAPTVGHLFATPDSSIIYFSAWDAELQRETIWQTDGTEGGAVKVFTSSSQLRLSQQDMEALRDDDRLIFRIATGGTDELWTVAGDGSAASLVGTFVNSPARSNSRMRMVGTTLYFAAQDAEHGWEIWSWDGSASPQVAWETVSGVGSWNPMELTHAGTDVYFLASSNVWRLQNGTAAPVAFPDFGSRTLMHIFSEDNQLFAWYREDQAVTLHYSLWKVDGLTKERIPGEFNRPSHIAESEVLAPGEFIFLADEVSAGLEPFVYSTSTGTATLVKNVNEGTYDGKPSPIISVGGQLGTIATVFRNKTLRQSLVTTNNQGTPVVSDSVISFTGGASGDDLYYVVGSSINQFVVHYWNGTNDQTLATMPTNIVPKLPGYRINGGVILFGSPVTDSNASQKLYFAQDGTVSEGFGDFRTASQFVHRNGILYFVSSSSSDGQEIWRSDGTPDGTYPITDLSSLQTGVTIHSLFVDSERLWFGYSSAGIQLTGFSDGTSDGTTLLQSLANVPATAKLLGSANGLWLFAETNGDGGLWATDGTSEGTRLLADQFLVTRAIPDSDGQSLWLVASGTAFSARTSLWKSDGTIEGTKAISSLPFAANVSELDNFTAIENRLFFTRVSGNSASHELWLADGTSSGTRQLRHGMEGTLKLDTPAQFTRYSHGIAFAGRTALAGIELFHINTSVEVAPPTDLTFEQSGEHSNLVWPDVMGAIQYEIWMENISNRTAPVIKQLTDVRDFRVSNLATPGDVYRIWVRSLPVLGRPSPWSESKDFVVASTPLMHSNPAITTNSRPTLRWAGPTDVTSFDLVVTDLDTGIESIDQTGIQGNSYVPLTELAFGRYSAKVRGRRANGSTTEWSPAADFTIFAPAIILTSGGGDSLVSRPLLTWKAVPGATGYDVQIMKSGTSTLVYRENNLQGTAHALKKSISDGQYKVWIRAIKGNQPLSIWGSGNDLHVKLHPTGLIRTGTLVAGSAGASWNSVPSAVSYTIELVNTFTGAKVQADTTQSTTSLIPSPALPGGQYSVRVRSNYATGSSSNWSPVLAFEVLRSAAAPITSSDVPTADATPIISWTESPGANGYEVFVSRQGSSAAVYNRTGIATTSHQIAVRLASGMHRIWVRPTFSDGSRGLWGAGQELLIGPAPVVTVSARTLSWTTMNGATHYEFWLSSISASGTATRVLYDSQFLSTSYTLPQTIPKGRYQLWVRTLRLEADSSYLGTWGTTGTFDLT